MPQAYVQACGNSLQLHDMAWGATDCIVYRAYGGCSLSSVYSAFFSLFRVFHWVCIKIADNTFHIQHIAITDFDIMIVELLAVFAMAGGECFSRG